MERRELAEWIVIITGIVAWWPRAFFSYSSGWYNALIYVIYPIALVVILVLRWRRMHEGLEFSRKIVDAHHQATGANVMGEQPKQSGPQSPYPDVVLPDHLDAPKSSGRKDDT